VHNFPRKGWLLSRPFLSGWIAFQCGAVLMPALAQSQPQPQIFAMNCEVQGVMSDAPDQKLPPATVTIEIQSIGKNIFMNLKGPKMFEMRISSLETEKNLGKNLTNAAHMGVNSKNTESGAVSEIVIERSKIFLQAYKDNAVPGRLARLNFQGPCRLP
jgi:hypothetical protein